jgi:Uncharacterized proteins of the AP superfamily
MTRLRVFSAFHALLLLAVALQPGCTHPSSPAASRPTPLLLLVAMDGFRWDYLDLYADQAPNLRRLRDHGATSRGLIPVFPSNTFPNHYSVVTGLYPSHHGIINNRLFDPTLGRFFLAGPGKDVTESIWWGGEPIWVTAEKSGVPAAVGFWPGSEAKIQGLRPSFWGTFDPRITFDTRFAEFRSWLALPAAERPRVIAFYFEEANGYGHRYGPESPELAEAIQLLDTQLAQLLDAIAAANLEVNLVIVADHGMTPISRERVIHFDDYIALEDVQIDFDGPVAGLRPLRGSVDQLLAAFASLPHARAYRIEDLPAHLHIDPANPRNPPVWILPDEGWEIYSRPRLAAWSGRFNKGDHGFDPALRSMHGLFLAHGPSIKTLREPLDAFENVHVYNLLCALAGLPPAPNDGDTRLLRLLKD